VRWRIDPAVVGGGGRCRGVLLRLDFPRLALDALLGLRFGADELLAGVADRSDELVELELRRLRIAVLGVWMRKTIRNVTSVVNVFATSRQVSENPNTGPLMAHPAITAIASANVQTEPVAFETLVATSPNQA
jgi:hypothetical protein